MIYLTIIEIAACAMGVWIVIDSIKQSKA